MNVREGCRAGWRDTGLAHWPQFFAAVTPLNGTRRVLQSFIPCRSENLGGTRRSCFSPLRKGDGSDDSRRFWAAHSGMSDGRTAKQMDGTECRSIRNRYKRIVVEIGGILKPNLQARFLVSSLISVGYGGIVGFVLVGPGESDFASRSRGFHPNQAFTLGSKSSVDSDR